MSRSELTLNDMVHSILSDNSVKNIREINDVEFTTHIRRAVYELAEKKRGLMPHPMELDWDSLQATRSRGFPVFKGAEKVVVVAPGPTYRPHGYTASDDKGDLEEGLNRYSASAAAADARLESPEGLREQILELEEKLAAATKERRVDFLGSWLSKPIGGVW